MKISDSEKLFRSAESARLLREDPKFKGLHYKINHLGDNLDLFKGNFDCIVAELNYLLSKELINQEIYDSWLHDTNSYATIYFNRHPLPDILAYQCCGCKKYFLEQTSKFLIKEIQTKLILNHVSSGFCSEKCLRDWYPDLADIILDNPKTKGL